METLTSQLKYDGKHALKCLEQEIRQIQGGKITCKQKGKILIIEKELKALEIIKNKKCLFKGLSETTQEEYDLLKEVFL